MIRHMNPAGLLTPRGPYSQVVTAGGFAYVSGQVGADADDVLVGPGAAEQCDQALRNIAVALEAVGMTMSQVVKVTVYVPFEEDLPDLVPHMDVVFPRVFGDGLPASTLIIVDRLFDPALRIEIEAVAYGG